jgi:hypothetical protein
VNANGLGLRVLRPPLEIEGYDVVATWHERQHHDPAHAWLRGLLAGVAAGVA